MDHYDNPVYRDNVDVDDKSHNTVPKGYIKKSTVIIVVLIVLIVLLIGSCIGTYFAVKMTLKCKDVATLATMKTIANIPNGATTTPTPGVSVTTTTVLPKVTTENLTSPCTSKTCAPSEYPNNTLSTPECPRSTCPTPECSRCLDGWVTYGETCYLFGSNKSMTFYEAVLFCRDRNAELIEVDSESENQFVKNYLLTCRVPYYWMGLTDTTTEGTFLLFSSSKPASFLDWANGEPNNGVEDCIVIASDVYYQWRDTSCTRWFFPPICERLAQ